jgi:hypothetical protein
MIKNGVSGSDSHWNIEYTANFLNQMTEFMRQDALPLYGKLSKVVGMFEAGSFGQQINMPSFSYFFDSLLLLCFGRTMETLIVMNNIVFLFITMAAVFFIGKKILNESLGLVAAVLLALMPGIFMLSREYLLDYPLIALVALGMMFLIYTDGFKRLLPVFLFGAVSGIGILTKAQYVFFLIGPALYVICRSFGQSNKVRSHIVLSLLLAFLISSLWWLHHPRQIIASFLNNSLYGYMPKRFTIGNGTVFGYSFNSIHWYVFYFVQTIAYSFAFLFPFYGFVILRNIKNIFKMPYFAELSLWFVVPLGILMFVSNKWAKYFFPTLPMVALVTAYALLSSRNKKHLHVVLILLVLASMVQYLVLSFSPIWGWRNALNDFFPYIQEVGIVHGSKDHRDKDRLEFSKANNVTRYIRDLSLKEGEYVVFANYSESNPYYPTIHLLGQIKLYFPEEAQKIIPLMRLYVNFDNRAISDAVRNRIKYFLVLGKNEKIYSSKLKEGSDLDEKKMIESILQVDGAGRSNFEKSPWNRE